MGRHQWLWLHVQLNEYSLASRVPEKKCHGTQPEEIGWNLPALVAKIPIHSSVTSQTVSLAFALQIASVAECPGPHPKAPFFQVSSGAPAPNWQLLPLPLEPSSSKSEGMPYYFSLWWQHSYCHYTSQCKCSILSGLEAMVPHQHIGPESSHSTLHLWM